MTLRTGIIDTSRNLSKYFDDWYGPTFVYWLNTSLVCIYNGGITFTVCSEGRFSEQRGHTDVIEIGPLVEPIGLKPSLSQDLQE